MKTYNVIINGIAPDYIHKIADKVQGQSIKEYFCVINNDIDFYVCDLKDCHGNTLGDKSAWMTSKDGLWSVNFNIS